MLAVDIDGGTGGLVGGAGAVVADGVDTDLRGGTTVGGAADDAVVIAFVGTTTGGAAGWDGAAVPVGTAAAGLVDLLSLG